MSLAEQRPREGRLHGPVSPADFYDWRREASSFSDMAAYYPKGANLTGGAEPQRIDGLRVTDGFLRVLGMAPALGRDFRAEEDADGRNRVILLSDGLWRRAFGADPSAVGRRVLLDGEPYEVAGVLPAAFWWPGDPAFLTPLALDDHDRTLRGAHFLAVLGRVRPGVSGSAGARGDGRHRPPSVGPLPGREHRPRPGAASDQIGAGRRHADCPAGPARRRRVRPADRVRQRRHAAARPGPRPPQGAGRPIRDGRKPRPDCPPAAGREPGALVRRRRGGPARRPLGVVGAPRDPAGAVRAAPRHRRRRPRRARARVGGRRVARERRRVRDRAGPGGLRSADRAGADRGCTRSRRSRAGHADSIDSRRRGARAVGRPAGRRGAPDGELPQSHGRCTGVPARPARHGAPHAAVSRGTGRTRG